MEAAVRDPKKQLLSRDEACKAMEVQELEQAKQAEAEAGGGVRVPKKQVELERGGIERGEGEREKHEQHSLQLQELEERHAVAQAQSEARLSELSLVGSITRKQTRCRRLQAEEMEGLLSRSKHSRKG